MSNEDSETTPPAQPAEALDEDASDDAADEENVDIEDPESAVQMGQQLSFQQNAEEQLDPEVQDRLDELREEYGELSELLVDVAFNEDVAEFILEAEDTIRHYSEKRAGKARFYIHREPTDEMYLMLSPKPAEFNASWLSMQNPQPERAVEAFERYADDILRTILVKPTFDEIDWQLDGSGVYQPMGLTKSRLVDAFLNYEMADPNAPTSTAFNDDEVDDAVNVAKNRDSKPSL